MLIALALCGAAFQMIVAHAQELLAEKDKPFSTAYDLKVLRKAAAGMSIAQTGALPAVLPGPRIDPPEIPATKVSNYPSYLSIRCGKRAGELVLAAMVLGQEEFPFYMGIAEGYPGSKITLRSESLVVTGLAGRDWSLGQADLSEFECRPNERYKFVPLKLNDDVELKVIRSETRSSCWEPYKRLYVREGKLNTVLHSSNAGQDLNLKLKQEHAYFRCIP